MVCFLITGYLTSRPSLKVTMNSEVLSPQLYGVSGTPACEHDLIAVNGQSAMEKGPAMGQMVSLIHCSVLDLSSELTRTENLKCSPRGKLVLYPTPFWQLLQSTSCQTYWLLHSSGQQQLNRGDHCRLATKLRVS